MVGFSSLLQQSLSFNLGRQAFTFRENINVVGLMIILFVLIFVSLNFASFPVTSALNEDYIYIPFSLLSQSSTMLLSEMIFFPWRLLYALLTGWSQPWQKQTAVDTDNAETQESHYSTLHILSIVCFIVIYAMSTQWDFSIFKISLYKLRAYIFSFYYSFFFTFSLNNGDLSLWKYFLSFWIILTFLVR